MPAEWFLTTFSMKFRRTQTFIERVYDYRDSPNHMQIITQHVQMFCWQMVLRVSSISNDILNEFKVRFFRFGLDINEKTTQLIAKFTFLSISKQNTKFNVRIMCWSLPIFHRLHWTFFELVLPAITYLVNGLSFLYSVEQSFKGWFKRPKKDLWPKIDQNLN